MDLKEVSQSVRQDVLRMIFNAGSGHPGGSLSVTDLLVFLYGSGLRQEPGGEDRLVLSKGHAAPALYATWAAFEKVDRRELTGFRQPDSPFQGHPDRRLSSMVEASTGSLGQGFSQAVGMALAKRHKGDRGRVFAILGDGELQEGQVWEAAMLGAANGLGNLCAIVDYNKMQSDDLNANICAIEPLADKWRAFGWRVEEIDGHQFGEIERAVSLVSSDGTTPLVVIAHTVKGKGVSFMEGSPLWHGSVTLSEAELRLSLADLGAGQDAIDHAIEERNFND